MLLSGLAMVFAYVARNSWVALREEAFNRVSRQMSAYSLLVGIAGFLFFGGLACLWVLFLRNMGHH